jgi:hypothetical protein
MTTSLARALTGLVLLSVLAAGCSDDDPGADGADGRKDSTPSAAGSPGAEHSPDASTAPDGAVGSAQCSLDRTGLSLVVRDWQRVYGSIGREDHSTYTGAFVTLLQQLRRSGEECNGAAELERFAAAARRVDAAARRTTPDYELYDTAIAAGNAWLKKVGYGNNALSVG